MMRSSILHIGMDTAAAASVIAPSTRPTSLCHSNPETVDDVEIGLKADWFPGDTSLRTNLAFTTRTIRTSSVSSAGR